MVDMQNTKRILVVEDEEMIARTIERELKNLGFGVAAVSTGDQALECAAAVRPDLALMDIHLQGNVDGVEAARILRTQLDIPVVYLTGYADASTWQSARVTGPFGYLVKPYDIQELQSTIELAIHQHETERAIRESEKRYRTLSELVSDFAYAIRVENDGSLVPEWSTNGNGTLQVMARLNNNGEASDARGSTIHPEDIVRMQQRLQNLLAGNSDITEYRAANGKGEFRWLRDYARPIFDNESGKVARILGAVQDITERVEAEEALRQANLELSQYVFQLTQRNREVTLLNEMGMLLQSCLTVNDVYDVLGDYGEKLFPGLSGAIAMYTEARSLLDVVVAWGDWPPSSSQQSPAGNESYAPPAASFEPSACWALRRGQVHVVDNPTTRLRCQHTGCETFRPSMCILIDAPDGALGVLTLCGETSAPIRNWEPLAQTVCERAALAFSNLMLREKLRQQSIRDQLTGLFNRRYMEQTLERELRRAVRHNRQLSVAMLDLDNFKPVNDRYGHDAGDLVLSEIAAYLQRNLRSEDTVCRFGGDEFTIILTEASPEDALRRFEELREGIKSLPLHYLGYPLTGIGASIGVAHYPSHGRTTRELLHNADKALYCAKETGRDRVSLAG